MDLSNYSAIRLRFGDKRIQANNLIILNQSLQTVFHSVNNYGWGWMGRSRLILLLIEGRAKLGSFILCHRIMLGLHYFWPQKDSAKICQYVLKIK